MSATEDQHLIIGAGPLGLAVAKALKEQRVPYRHVEATDHVGGNWAHGVYETAHIISSRKTTQYPDFPMPESYPDFPSGAQMRAYYEDFTDAHALRAAIEFERAVTSVRPRSDELWDVDFGDGTSAVHKGVVVCNGHHWAKRFPPWVAQFEGEVLHSKDYKRPAQLEGKRVLVLGGGNSGCDLASEAARVSSSADWSLRRGYWFMPKTLFGVPSIELMNPYAPMWLQRLVMRLLIRLSIGKYADYGLPHPTHRMFDAHPTINSEVFHYLQHGRLRPRPDVVSIDGSTIAFTDGASAEYDAVVCATGYDLAFPFLPEGLVPVDDKVAQLYGGMLRPDYRHLYIFGAYQVRYGIGPVIRPGALAIAHLAKLQDELPMPLGWLLKEMGSKPPTSHLIGPFETIRALERVVKWVPALRRMGKRYSSRWTAQEREVAARRLQPLTNADEVTTV
ncbi:MAG: NAD(P)-binding domain-containing protein [Deltaproteobacteria bacterium]|nr:NAD(P)-binding domain-containing protein [Deltaproteobacteria bacterium]